MPFESSSCAFDPSIVFTAPEARAASLNGSAGKLEAGGNIGGSVRFARVFEYVCGSSIWLRSNCKLERTGSLIISSSGLDDEKDAGGGDDGPEADRGGASTGTWSWAASSEAEWGDIMRTVFPALPLDGRGMSTVEQVSTSTMASYQRDMMMILY